MATVLTAMASAPERAAAGVSGRLDTLLQLDNRARYDDTRLEQRAELRYADREHGRHAAFDVALRQREGALESEVHQLYARQLVDAHQLSAGRFERADALGYYSLDGLGYDWRDEQRSITTYAGRPRRIEDYRFVDADWLLGIEGRARQQLHWTPAAGAEMQQLDARLGLQHLERDGDDEQRLGFGLTARGVLHDRPVTAFTTSAQGDYVTASGFERLAFDASADFDKDARVRISLVSYEPERPYLGFRERFYSRYALGRQTVLQGSYHRRLSASRECHAGARRISREIGARGYGLSAGCVEQLRPGWEIEGQLDVQWLDEDRLTGLFASADHALSARDRLQFSTALDYQDKQLAGDNAALGLEAQWQRMLRGDLYVALFAMHILNSRLSDEYRGGARLSYRFDDRIRGARP